MSTLFRIPAGVRDAVLLVARALLGVIFLAHGLQMFTSWGIDTVTAGFAKSGIPMPGVSAAFSAAAQTGGGVLMILGAFTPIAGVLLAFNMAGAFWFMHSSSGIFVADGGWELVAALGSLALVLAVVGPGRLSIDRLLTKGRTPADADRELADSTH